MKDKSRPTRRQAIVSGATGVAVLLAGCISDGEENQNNGETDEDDTENTPANDQDSSQESGSSSEENDDYDPEGGEDRQASDTQSGTETKMSFEIIQIGGTASAPTLGQASQDQVGTVTLHSSPDDTRSGDAISSFFDDEKTREFIEKTNFETQRLIQIGSVGPTGCHDQLEVEELAVEDETVTGKAAVIEPPANTVCTEVITYPGALIRVDTLIDEATLEITDGWGETETVQSAK